MAFDVGFLRSIKKYIYNTSEVLKELIIVKIMHRKIMNKFKLNVEVNTNYTLSQVNNLKLRFLYRFVFYL